MRRIVSGVLAAIFVALAVFSKYSLLNAKSQYDKLRNSLLSFNSIKTATESSKRTLSLAKRNFEDNRASDIYFGDIDRLVTVLNNVATISVTGWEPFSAEDGFVAVPSSTNFTAARISLVVDNIDLALNVIDKLELPIYSIVISEPNMIDVIFLTGNAIE